ncbi:MAG: hypothetical protein JWR57_937 [Mycetocola sp.]|nr:hypothetical protein [Mycetocola sp.]
MLFVALVCWAFASPVGASPDDDYHMASIWCGSGLQDGLCESGDSEAERRVPATLLEASGCYAFQPAASASCPQKESNVLVESTRGNFDGGYPPVFYAVMSTLAGPDVSVSVVLMRMLNSTLFVGVSTALFWLLPRNQRGPLLWGALATIVPLGMFLIASVNPSSWAVMSAATLWVALLGYFKSETRKRKVAFGAIALLMTVAGAGARSDSAVYSVLAMAVVLVLAFEPSRKFVLSAILPAALACAAVFFFLIAGQSGVVNPDAFAKDDPGVSLISLTFTNLLQLPTLWIGSLGSWGLGWLDTALPGLVWVTTVAVLSGLVFWGIQKLNWRKALALGMVFGSLVVVPMYILVHDRVIVGAGVQPRYVYPLIVMLAGLALLHFDRDSLKLNRTQLSLVAICLTMANSIALHVNIRRYVTGIDGVGFNLDTGIEWWWNMPFSPMFVWMVGTLAFGAALAGAVRYSVSQGSSENGKPHAHLPRGVSLTPTARAEH